MNLLEKITTMGDGQTYDGVALPKIEANFVTRNDEYQVPDFVASLIDGEDTELPTEHDGIYLVAGTGEDEEPHSVIMQLVTAGENKKRISIHDYTIYNDSDNWYYGMLLSRNIDGTYVSED